jgi:hypothetical protein
MWATPCLAAIPVTSSVTLPITSQSKLGTAIAAQAPGQRKGLLGSPLDRIPPAAQYHAHRRFLLHLRRMDTV